MNDPVEDLCLSCVGTGYMVGEANNALDYYRAMLAAKERAEAERDRLKQEKTGIVNQNADLWVEVTTLKAERDRLREVVSDMEKQDRQDALDGQATMEEAYETIRVLREALLQIDRVAEDALLYRGLTISAALHQIREFCDRCKPAPRGITRKEAP